MQATGNSLLESSARGVTTIAVLTCGALLCACATDRSQWMDHATLVIRPSQHQAAVAFAFGAGPPRMEAGALAERNIAATIAAAAVVRDNPLPSLDTMDFKGGRVFIHSPREH